MGFRLRKEIDELLEKEENLIERNGESRVALGYPNFYQIGMSNLGFQTIYAELNRKGVGCDRFFLPKKNDLEEYEKSKTLLFSWEEKRKIKSFPIVGFSLSFELDYLNVLKMLKLADIEFLSEQRDEDSPLLVAGGPCAFFNPEPLADIFDVFFVGEGEEMTPEFCQKYLELSESGMGKKDILKVLATMPGIYVPSLYKVEYDDDGMIEKRTSLENAPEMIQRQWIKNLDDHRTESVILTPDMQFGDMYLSEISRGCGRHCRFCMAGFSYRPPRTRSLEKVWQSMENGLRLKNKIGLVGAAISDYPEIDELCERIAARGGEISVSSLRVDSLTETLLKAVVESGSKNITIAPEAGSERLRRVINKGITNEDIQKIIPLLNKYQIPQIKLYFMIGLPTETEKDLEEMIELAITLRDSLAYQGKKRIVLGVTPFVPKPFTPFQWQPMEELKSLEKKINYLKKRVNTTACLELNYESPRMAALQGILARGDRRIGRVLLENYESTSLGSYKKALKEIGLSLDLYLYRERAENELFPWDFIETGVKREYLYQEREKGLAELNTAPCPKNNKCHRCGVCSE